MKWNVYDEARLVTSFATEIGAAAYVREWRAKGKTGLWYERAA